MKPAPSPKPLHIGKDDTEFDRNTNIWVAIVLLVLLVLQMIFLPVGWEFDMESPDFNPMIMLPLLLMALIVWNLGKGAVLWRRLRRFGTSIIELHGPGQPVPGGVCRGLVRTAGEIAALGDFQLTMRCVESYRFGKPGQVGSSNDRYESVTAWEETLTIEPSAADPRAGLPFEYKLPKVGPLAEVLEPTYSGDKPYFRMQASLNIPGMKKHVIAKNQKPARRSWWLDVSAPTRDGKFRAKFQVPVLEKSA